MKCYALAKRDKPKDAYDIAYCLLNAPGGMKIISENWQKRLDHKDIKNALRILNDKFKTVSSFGPQQVADFYNPPSKEEHDLQSRRAFEAVQSFLGLTET